MLVQSAFLLDCPGWFQSSHGSLAASLGPVALLLPGGPAQPVAQPSLWQQLQGQSWAGAIGSNPCTGRERAPLRGLGALS